MTTYASRDDAIQNVIIDPIEATDAAKREEYDIEWLADEILEWVDGYDEALNVYWLNSQGYRVRDTIDPDTFWDLVGSALLPLPDHTCKDLGIDVNNRSAREQLIALGVDATSLRRDSPEVLLALAIYPNP